MIRKLLIIASVTLVLILISLFLPARRVTIEGIGWLSFETTITLSVGQEVAYASPGWLSGWGKRVQITIDSTDIGEDLTHFPVLIHLSSACGKGGAYDLTPVFGEVGSNSKRIAVTKDDEVTQLYVEIEKWDAVAGEAWLWVSKSDWTISSTGTDIYLYYDNSQLDNITYVGDSGSRPEVWNSHFKGVWHLKEDPAGTAPQMKDSTINGNDGISRGSMTSGDSVNGKIYKAIDLDGDDDFIGIPNDTSHAPANVTLSAWVNFDMDETSIAIISRLQAAGYGLYERYGEGLTYGYGIQFFVRVAGTYYGAYTGTSTDPMQGITVGNWYYFVGTYDGETVRIYLEGNEKTPNTSPSGDIDYGTSSPPLELGSDPNGDTPDPIGSMWFDGQLDEVRVSDIARSDDWIKASYKSERDDLLNFGSEEALDISNTPSSKDFGVVTAGSTPNTGNAYFAITNDSTVNITVTIVCNGWTDTIDGTSPWTYGAAAPDTAQLKASDGDGAYDVTVDDTTPATLHTTSTPGDDFSWELQLDAPTLFTHGHSQQTTVTLTATAS